MATAQVDRVMRHLRRAVQRQDAASRTDGQLLASFIYQKDEAAFETLVHRHGPMVFGVCRRVVGNHHDAEDAFQASFLVLARKASSVRPRERVANWLHGVALRTAMKAKALSAKRRGREKQVTEMPEPEVAQQGQWRDLQPLLDQELNGLPENYRLPILLCDLEGKTIKEATQRLGWPQGTLAGRLARGRKLLATRLASRGVVLSGGSVAAVISQNVASAGVPLLLLNSTVKAVAMIAAGQATVAGMVPAKVAILTEGVLKAMLLTKLKTIMAAFLVVAAVGFGGDLLSRSTTAAGQTADERLHKEVGEQSPDQQPPKATRDGHSTELRTGSLIFGVGVNSEAGLTGSVVVNERNFNIGVGPNVNGFKVGGDFLLLNSLEYQIPVRANGQVYVVPFVDSGTVGSPPVPADTKAVAPKTDLERLQGVWSVVSIEHRQAVQAGKGRLHGRWQEGVLANHRGRNAGWLVFGLDQQAQDLRFRDE
jgi:RNA polymerase sigma factor (sigma-70 family)